MSAATKKPPGGTTPGRRGSNDPAMTSPSRGSGRSTTPTSSSTGSPNGLGRSRSTRGSTPVSARAALQRPGAGNSNLNIASSADDASDDARAEAVNLIDDLKEQLRKAELASDQFQKQAQVTQSRLNEAVKEQGKLEDKLHESEERLELIKNEKRDAVRQKREMENIYEAERSSMTKEKDEMVNREEEMQAIIQRLKDSLNQKANVDEDTRVSRRSNNSSPRLEDGGQFAPSSGLNRSDSRNNSKLILQKDKLIESLRLELAEAQIKLMETENMGGGRLQEVEKLLLETRMANARLMEDNESFQLLLQEKTLNGDFTKSEFMGSSSNADALNALEGRTSATSLADELSEAADDDTDKYRRLEAELKSSKDQNKALTLYINKIIERLLQHQDFEAILDQSSEFKPGPNTEKSLPPPPPKEAASGTSILQRAKSIATGNGRRPRPQSQMPASSQSAHNDPDTAPSIPFGHSRGGSRQFQRPASDQFGAGAANVVNQMYKGGTTSPLNGPQSPRNSFFPPNGAPAARKQSVSGSFAGTQTARKQSVGQAPTSGNFPGTTKSDASSISGESGEVNTPSPPRPDRSTTFAGNKPRPLRLVQDIEEDKKAKRASWMGWAFNRVQEPAVKEEGVTKDNMPLREDDEDLAGEDTSGLNAIF